MWCGFKRVKARVNVLICGVHNAGKTTTVRRLASLGRDDIVPTMGREEETITVHGVEVQLIDTSGKFKNIVMKNDTYDCHGVIFVCDSASKTHLEDAKEWLHDVLNNMYIKDKGKPILVLGNKQDLPEAQKSRELYSYLGIDEVESEQSKLFKLYVTSGEYKQIDRGLKNGLKWLIQTIMTNWKTLEATVNADSKEFQEQEASVRAEKRKRIQSTSTAAHSRTVSDVGNPGLGGGDAKPSTPNQNNNNNNVTDDVRPKTPSRTPADIMESYMDDDVDLFEHGFVDKDSPAVKHPKKRVGSKLNTVEPIPTYSKPRHSIDSNMGDFEPSAASASPVNIT